MSDTQRTRAAILALMDNNVTGQISAQDLRDYTVTVMEEEFANPGDFWKQPSAKKITTDASGKGWKDYSQTMNSACSFANVLAMDSDGGWIRADAANSLYNGLLALAMDSYAAGISTAELLRKGIVYYSAWSTLFSGYKGRPIYLDSGVAGSVSMAAAGVPTYSQIIGWVETSDGLDSAIGKFRFCPNNWAITGV